MKAQLAVHREIFSPSVCGQGKEVSEMTEKDILNQARREVSLELGRISAFPVKSQILELARALIKSRDDNFLLQRKLDQVEGRRLKRARNSGLDAGDGAENSDAVGCLSVRVRVRRDSGVKIPGQFSFLRRSEG